MSLSGHYSALDNRTIWSALWVALGEILGEYSPRRIGFCVQLCALRYGIWLDWPGGARTRVVVDIECCKALTLVRVVEAIVLEAVRLDEEARP